MSFADDLIAEIEGTGAWPLPREREPRAVVAIRRAFRRADALRFRADRDLLVAFLGWEDRCRELWPSLVGGRELIIDPLPKRAALAFGDFLWSAEPTFTAASEDDQPWLDLLIEENQLASRLHRAETVKVSEGETWWKVWTDHDAAVAPTITFSSRLDVVPLFRGDRLLAVAFCAEWVQGGYGGHEPNEIAGTPGFTGGGTVYRHLEVHEAGRVVNRLYRGTRGQIGDPVALDTRPETAGMLDEWTHGLPMLAGRVVNDLDDSHELGISDYDQLTGLFGMLSEARTIAAENTRLTAKKRLLVAGELLGPSNEFDAGTDVVRVDAGGGIVGQSPGTPPVTEAEYSYDSKALNDHLSETEKTALSRMGLVPQLIGRDVAGQGESGFARRLVFLPTENASQAKAREWDDKLPNILQLALMVDNLPADRGGFGRSYRDLLAPPTVVRGSILPRDDQEIVKENAVAVTAGIRSRRTAIRAQHEGWTDHDVDTELAEIATDEQVGGASLDVPPPAESPHPAPA